MRLGLVINDVAREHPRYTTTRLAIRACEMGHEVWVIGVGDLAYDPNGEVYGRGRRVPAREFEDGKAYLAHLEDTPLERIGFDDLDVAFLRNNPADDMDDQPWACPAAILFSQLAVRRSTIVLNDPSRLASAFNKTYFQHFPEEVRPRTLITRCTGEIKAFIREQGGRAVIKPLQGSGGRNVFVVREGAEDNVHQMIEAVIRDGFAVVQEYLPEAARGDVRLFVMNGIPLERDGKYAALRRVNDTGDARSNMHAGGRAAAVEVDDAILQMADIVRPKLVDDGMFLVGLDIVGDKLMEVNVFSPGGLCSIEELTGCDFAGRIIDSLAHKVEYKKRYGNSVTNIEYATL
jgi:glutathione synthase